MGTHPTPGRVPARRGPRAAGPGAGDRPRGSVSAARETSWGEGRAGAARGGPDGRPSSPAGQVSRHRVARVALRGGAVVVHGAGGAEGCGQQLHGGRRPGGHWGRVGGRAGGRGPGRGRRAGSGAGSQRARLEPELPRPPLPSAPAGGRAGGRAPGGSRGCHGNGGGGRARAAGARPGGGGAGEPGLGATQARGHRLRPGPSLPAHASLPAAAAPRRGEGGGRTGGTGELRLRLPAPSSPCGRTPAARGANLKGTGEGTLGPMRPRTSASLTPRILCGPPQDRRRDPRLCRLGPNLGGVSPRWRCPEGVRGRDWGLREPLHSRS